MFPNCCFSGDLTYHTSLQKIWDKVSQKSDWTGSDFVGTELKRDGYRASFPQMLGSCSGLACLGPAPHTSSLSLSWYPEEPTGFYSILSSQRQLFPWRAQKGV